MLFDTHVHLSSFEPGEREKQIDTAKGLGTTTFVEVAGSADNVPKAVELAESRDDFYFGVACHPNRVEMYSGEKDLALFRKTFKEHPEKMVCIGECGLDYGEADDQRAEKQRELFRDMIRLARELGLPLNMHSERLCTRDLLTILKSRWNDAQLRREYGHSQGVLGYGLLHLRLCPYSPPHGRSPARGLP